MGHHIDWLTTINELPQLFPCLVFFHYLCIMNEQFYEILRSELWQQPLTSITLSPAEVGAYIDEAKKQSVAGLFCNSLVSNDIHIGKELTLKALAIVNKVSKGNRKRNFDVGKFSSFLKRHDIPFVIVKGQSVAALYPHPELRQSGDIDVYCGEAHFIEARDEIAKKTDLHFDPAIPVKHLAFSIDGSKYELHRILSIFSYPKHQRFFNEKMEKALVNHDEIVINGVGVPVLAPTDSVFFQTVHIFYHVIKEGIGLRQLCDLAVFMDKTQERIDFSLLLSDLKKIGLEEFFQAIVHILTTQLGWQIRVSTFIPRYTKLAEKILNDVNDGGNFGKALEENRVWVILRHYLKYFSYAPKEILCIPLEKFSRRWRGVVS